MNERDAVAQPQDPATRPGTRPAAGRQAGPVRLTPARVTLLIAFAGGLGFLAYSTIDRGQLQIPLMASGFAICSLVFASAAVLAVPGVMRAGREGRDGAAVLIAFVGGLFAAASLLSIAAAVIMSLIWSGSNAS